MRIIAGQFKGRKLSSPRGSGTRPTSDRVREAVFSMLRDRLRGTRVLDLFAGTGAMGIEALSRGADTAVFVEKDPEALRCLESNVDAVGCRDRVEIVNRPVLSFIRSLDPDSRFGIVFADPPYRGDMGTLTLLAISKHAKCLEGCLVIMEHSPERKPEPIPPNLRVTDSRRYGNTGITIFSFMEKRGTD